MAAQRPGLTQALDLMIEVCYLCGFQITSDQARSDDHVIPETLIKRSQPKVKGYDYGHFLPTHASCNNGFLPETYVSKALDLLCVLNSPDLWKPLQHRLDASITMQPIDASKLSHFTPKDLIHFQLIDARQADTATLSDPDFYAGRKKINPMRGPLLTALSVVNRPGNPGGSLV